MKIIKNISNAVPKQHTPDDYLCRLQQVYFHYRTLHVSQSSPEIRAEMQEARKACLLAIQSINAQSAES